MSQSTPAPQSDSLPIQDVLSMFNNLSWLVCTYGLGVLLAVISLLYGLATEQDFGVELVLARMLSAVVCGTYLLFPYWLYQRQVIGGKELDGLWWLAMALYTGILFGYVILVLFDILRQILKMIMKPQGSEQINFMFGGSK